MRVDRASAILAGLQPDALTTGALVRSVEVVDCVRFTPEIASEMRDVKAYFGDWQAGPLAWELRDHMSLATPVLFRRRLGLFTVPDSVIGGAKRQRSHSVQYHYCEKMGYGCDDVKDFQIVTRKPLQWLRDRVLGNTIWLVVGEGTPRRFSVCLMFQADQLGNRLTPAAGRPTVSTVDTDVAPALTPAMFHILLALADRERHGYDIMREVAHFSGGQLRLGPGTLYRSLRQLLADGFIAEADERPDPALDDARRRYYHLTDTGAHLARAHAERLAQLLDVARAKQLKRAPRRRPAPGAA